MNRQNPALRIVLILVVLVISYFVSKSRQNKPPTSATTPTRTASRSTSTKTPRPSAAEKPTPNTLFWTADSVPGAPPKTGPISSIGCWNIEWFSLDGKNARTEADVNRIAGVIRQSGVALLGVEEIQDEAALDGLVRHLPGWKYFIGTTGRQQRCAILWDAARASVDRPVEWPDVNEGIEKGEGNLRAPLVATARVGKFDFTFVVLHLKALFEPEDLQARRKQLSRIRKHLDQVVTEQKDKDVIVVGDYNDFADSTAMKELTRRSGGTGYIVSDTRLPDSVGTYLGKSGRIDHIVLSSPAVSQEEWTNEVFVFPKPKGGDRDLYEETVSDHLPTWATFRTDKDND